MIVQTHTRTYIIYSTSTYHKLTFIIEDLSHLAILRKQLLKSGEKQCICIFAVLNLAHKHVQLNEFCSDFNSETSSELLPLRSTIINLLFFFSKKIFFFYIHVFSYTVLVVYIWKKKKMKMIEKKEFFWMKFFFRKKYFPCKIFCV